MVRVAIVGIVIGVAFILYALVDAAMTDGSRARGVGKPLWVVIIALLPVVGAVLWFTIGKGSPRPQPRSVAPDDDPRFTGRRMSNEDLDAHMRDLEEQLQALDDETYPGEAAEAAEGHASADSSDAGEVAEESDGPEIQPRPDDPNAQ